MLCKKVFQILLNLPFIFLVFPQEAKGIDLDYQLTLQGDGSGRPHITLQVSNLNSESLKLVVNTPLVDDYGNYYPDLIIMIHNLSVKDAKGNTLAFSFSQKTITSPDWYWNILPIYHDVYSINIGQNRQITVEYDVASNTEIFTGLGATDNAFNGQQRMTDFWHGYLEFILFRPENHSDVSSADIYFSLPSNWDYEVTTLGTSLNNEVNLGTLNGMYGDNIRWKNYQRSSLVIYNKSKFNVKKKDIKGIRVADVYSADLEGYRNQEAFFQYFEYLCDKIGTLPINSHLTFYPFINGNEIPYLRAYQSGPNGFGHGLMGEFYGAGGDIGLGSGGSLDQVQLWDFDSFDDEKNYTFSMHGTVRPWIFLFIQFTWDDLPWFKGGFCTYYENMCVAQRYGLNNIIERRFKPMYKYYIDNIAGPPEVDKKNFSNHSFVEYFKSCLTAYYIDQLLKENSSGNKTIDDLMKLLFQKAEQGIAINREIFTEALNSLTSYDFTSVVENYLYGSGKLPLDGYLTNAPKVITGSASSVTLNSATLNGTVNPNGEATTYYFEYGTDTNYGSTTSSVSAGSGTSAVSVNDSISGLSSDTTYHYRLVATNSEGTSYGDDKTFSTVVLYVNPSGACGGNTSCYSTIQNAIDSVPSGATIKIAQGNYDEDLFVETSNNFTLQGGWDSSFTTQSSSTTVNSMTISDDSGTVEIENIVLQ